MPAQIVSPRGQAPPEFPDWPRVVEARLIEWIAAPLTGGKRLVELDALAKRPLADEAGILPVSYPAFVQIGAAWR